MLGVEVELAQVLTRCGTTISFGESSELIVRQPIAEPVSSSQLQLPYGLDASLLGGVAALVVLILVGIVSARRKLPQRELVPTVDDFESGGREIFTVADDDEDEDELEHDAYNDSAGVGEAHIMRI